MTQGKIYNATKTAVVKIPSESYNTHSNVCFLQAQMTVTYWKPTKYLYNYTVFIDLFKLVYFCEFLSGNTVSVWRNPFQQPLSVLLEKNLGDNNSIWNFPIFKMHLALLAVISLYQHYPINRAGQSFQTLEFNHQNSLYLPKVPLQFNSQCFCRDRFWYQEPHMYMHLHAHREK